MALIIGNLWFVGDTGIRKRVLTLLHQKSATLAEVRDVLKELLRNIGDEGASGCEYALRSSGGTHGCVGFTPHCVCCPSSLQKLQHTQPLRSLAAHIGGVSSRLPILQNVCVAQKHSGARLFML